MVEGDTFNSPTTSSSISFTLTPSSFHWHACQIHIMIIAHRETISIRVIILLGTIEYNPPIRSLAFNTQGYKCPIPPRYTKVVNSVERTTFKFDQRCERDLFPNQIILHDVLFGFHVYIGILTKLITDANLIFRVIGEDKSVSAWIFIDIIVVIPIRPSKPIDVFYSLSYEFGRIYLERCIDKFGCTEGDRFKFLQIQEVRSKKGNSTIIVYVRRTDLSTHRNDINLLFIIETMPIHLSVEFRGKKFDCI